MQNNNKSYASQKHRIALIKILFTPIILILFLIIGAPVYFSQLSAQITGNLSINLVFFYLITGAIYYMISFPLEYYSGFKLEHKYSLSNQAFKDWFIHEVKKGIVCFIVGIPFIFSVYSSLRFWPLHWWLITALLWFFMSVLLAKFAPILIIPLFYKYSPIKDAELKNRLIQLAEKAGFAAKGVYVINISRDTKKANAALIGMGRQKRIVLCDTLFGNFNDGEIESIMGHELGHHKNKHLLKLVLFGGASTVLTFFITNVLFLHFHSVFGYTLLCDFESLILIYAILSVLNILTLPIHNAFSRKLEKEADLFTLKITKDKEAFISTMNKLAIQNLSDPDPGKFYEILLYNHPPISRRISFAKSLS